MAGSDCSCGRYQDESHRKSCKRNFQRDLEAELKKLSEQFAGYPSSSTIKNAMLVQVTGLFPEYRWTIESDKGALIFYAWVGNNRIVFEGPNYTPMVQRTCCSIGCPNEAEYEIFTKRYNGEIAGPDPYSDDSDACTIHVGELLGHQPAMVDPQEAYWEVRPIEEEGLVKKPWTN